MIKSLTLVDALFRELIDVLENDALTDVSEPLREARVNLRRHLDAAELRQIARRERKGEAKRAGGSPAQDAPEASASETLVPERPTSETPGGEAGRDRHEPLRRW